MKRIEDCQKNGGNLEEVREVGIIAATGGLEISEILEISRDFKHIVHHLPSPTILLLLLLIVAGALRRRTAVIRIYTVLSLRIRMVFKFGSAGRSDQ